MVGATTADEPAVRAFLGTFAVVPIDSAVAESAVRLRRDRRLRLPDATIWAKARAHHALLVTRNTEDFPASASAAEVESPQAWMVISIGAFGWPHSPFSTNCRDYLAGSYSPETPLSGASTTAINVCH